MSSHPAQEQSAAEQHDWSAIQRWITEAVASGSPMVPVESIENRIALGELVLWTGKAGLAIANVEENRKARGLVILYLGGNAAEIIKGGNAQFKQFGRYMDCDHLIVQAKPSLSRTMKNLGYRAAFTTFIKDLNQGHSNE